MKFYGRNQEIIRLLQLDEQSHATSVFTLWFCLFDDVENLSR